MPVFFPFLKVSCAHSLLVDYMTSMSKMSKKIQKNQLEKEEMKTRMEEALVAEKAVFYALLFFFFFLFILYQKPFFQPATT